MVKKRSKQKGSALIFSLILILVLSVMGSSLMFLSQTETWSSMNYRMMTQGRYGAEAGLNVATDFFRNNNTYTAPTGPFGCAGVYNTCVSPVTYNGNPVVLSSGSGSNYPTSGVVTAFQNAINTPGKITAGNTTVNYSAKATLLSMGTVNSYGNTITVQMWQITADGTVAGVQNGQEEVTAIIEQQVSPATMYAAFATANGCGALSFSGGGETNSYNSNNLTVNASGVATPPSSFNTYGGNVGSNGNLNENGAPTIIYGTMSTPDTGVGNCSAGNVTAWTDNGKAQVTGGLVKLPQTVTFTTPVIPPPGATNENINSGVTLPPGNYGDIKLTGAGVLTLTPGIYNINSISDSGANTSIVVAPDPVTHQYGQVIINVTGNNQSTPIDLTGNSFQNPTLKPIDLQINYAGTGVIKLAGNSSAAAVVYAPNANITLKGGSDFYGAIIGQYVDNAGGVTIHYDLSLNQSTYTVTPFMLDNFTWAKF